MKFKWFSVCVILYISQKVTRVWWGRCWLCWMPHFHHDKANVWGRNCSPPLFRTGSAAVHLFSTNHVNTHAPTHLLRVCVLLGRRLRCVPQASSVLSSRHSLPWCRINTQLESPTIRTHTRRLFLSSLVFLFTSFSHSDLTYSLSFLVFARFCPHTMWGLPSLDNHLWHQWLFLFRFVRVKCVDSVCGAIPQR